MRPAGSSGLAADFARAVAEDVGVDHGRRYLPVAERLLHGADVVTALQKMGRERMAEGMATGTLVDAGRADCAGYGALDVRLMIVMPALGRLALRPRRGRKKTHCQRQSRDAAGNFRSIGSGSQTRPKPAARSS